MVPCLLLFPIWPKEQKDHVFCKQTGPTTKIKHNLYIERKYINVVIGFSILCYSVELPIDSQEGISLVLSPADKLQKQTCTSKLLETNQKSLHYFFFIQKSFLRVDLLDLRFLGTQVKCKNVKCNIVKW